MRKESLTVYSVCMLLFSSDAHAGAGWTDYARVAELIPTAHHYYEVRLPVNENPSGCNNKVWFYQDYRAPGSDKIFETILEGVKAGIRARVYVTGKFNINGYAEISSVSVIP